MKIEVVDKNGSGIWIHGMPYNADREKFTKGCIALDNNELENAVQTMAQNIANYNLSALIELKKVLWKGTENWDELLKDRAAISGKLVLSSFTKEALKKFRK